MKRIAVSLGSLSLVFMQNGQCETADPVEAFPAIISDVQAEMQVQEEQEESDELSFLETDSQELEEQLLSLEQELEMEQNSAIETDNILASDDASDDQKPMASTIDDLQAQASEADNQATAPSQQASDTLAQQEEASLAEKSIFHDTATVALEDEVNAKVESPSPLIAHSDEAKDKVAQLQDSSQETIAVEVANDSYEIAKTSDAIPSAALSVKAASKSIEISLSQVFAGSPMIYLLLLMLSVISVALWLFNLLSLKKYASTSNSLMKNVRNKLMSNHYDEVLTLCKEDNSFFSKMMSTGVSSRKYGLQFMLESMKSEGKRASVSFWQRLSILHDIAIIAPMLGLLGTVLGMFYAFYDLNRSFESISSLFDGLGVSVGTTVAGIFVAILAMVLHSISKYKLVKSLSFVESEAVTLAHLIDSNKHGQ